MNPISVDPPIRVATAQFKPRKGDVAGNLARVGERTRALSGQADLVVFPEAALSGYFVEGGVFEAAQTTDEVAAGLGAAGEGAPDVVLGYYERHQRQLYNSAGYFTARDGAYRPVHVHRKLFLPTYGVFDEARFVEAGHGLRAFDTPLGRMGMLVCEDMWHSLPPAILALDGAELILVPSASPAREFPPGAGVPKNLVRWDALARNAALEHGLFVVVSQLVGSEGGKMFPGGSVAVGPDGETLGRAGLLEEEDLVVALSGARIDRARAESPLLADLAQMLPHLREALAQALARRERARLGAEEREGSVPLHEGGAAPGADSPGRRRRDFAGRAPGSSPSPGPDPEDASVLDLDLPLVERFLVEFIHEEVRRRRGFDKVVLGVSGGVDSAVALYLACKALGAENVHGFRLPYATSSQSSLDDGALVLEASGAQVRTLDITAAVDGYIETHEPEISGHRRGNVAARIRAVTLFDQAFKLGGLPLGTGNKSERLLGYYTWHADDSPPINPLGDLFKTQVWALARQLGVPSRVVDKPASADLVEGIHDEDELGISYHKADLILHWLLRGYHPEELAEYGFDEEEVRLVRDRLAATHWKRELPTVAVLSSSAIGEFYLRPVDY
jgi:NAD+ synthetase